MTKARAVTQPVGKRARLEPQRRTRSSRTLLRDPQIAAHVLFGVLLVGTLLGIYGIFQGAGFFLEGLPRSGQPNDGTGILIGLVLMSLSVAYMAAVGYYSWRFWQALGNRSHHSLRNMSLFSFVLGLSGLATVYLRYGNFVFNDYVAGGGALFLTCLAVSGLATFVTNRSLDEDI